MDDELMNDPYAKKWIEAFNQGLENFWWKRDPPGIGLKAYRGLAVVRPPEENPTWEKWSSRYLYGNPRPRYKAKAYEAPYQFPRDLMEAIDDMVEAYADTCSETPNDFHRSRQQYETIHDQIADYIETFLYNARES